MEFSVNLDLKKVKKGLDLTEKQMKWLSRRAITNTARNLRVQISKANMGVGNLRRKKVVRARVKPLTKRGALWIGTNDFNASEFKGRPVEGNGGVTFNGKFYKDAFLGRFKGDKRRRILQKTSDSKVREVMVHIEPAAKKFLTSKIQPQIPERLQHNIEQNVDNLKYVIARKRAKK